MTEIEKKALIECLILVRELAYIVAFNTNGFESVRSRKFSDIAGGLVDVLRGADTIDAKMVLEQWEKQGR